MNEAYHRIITAAEEERRDLFVSTARRITTTEQNVEKDFWACWTLDALCHGRPENADAMTDMIIGPIPGFDGVLNSIAEIEERLNNAE